MKKHKRLVVFTCLWSVFAAITYGLAESSIPRLPALALWVIIGVAFGLGYASWHVSNRVVAWTLCATLSLLPFQSRARDGGEGEQNKSAVAIICGCVVIVGGIVIVISLKKLCNKLPSTQPPDTEPPPPPPWTGNTNIINPNYPPYYITNGVIVTNVVIHSRAPRLAMNDAMGVAYFDASNTGWHNPDGSAVQALAKTVLETSPDMVNWQPLYAISAYASGSSVQVVYRAPNGDLLVSAQAPVSVGTWGSVAPIPLLAEDPKRFYRLRTP